MHAAEQRVKAVLDTNVVVSALLTEGGMEALVLDLAQQGRYIAAVSDALVTEYLDVLRRPRLRIAPDLASRAIDSIRAVAVHVTPRTRVTAALDPDDNMVIECALAAGAGYIVTGNQRHFPAEFHGVKTVSARQFLAVLASALD